MSGNPDQYVAPTAALKQQAINSEASFEDYTNNWKPLVDKYVAQTSDPAVKASEEKKVAGQINADLMKKVGDGKATPNPVQNTKQIMNLEKIKTGAEQRGQSLQKGKEIGDEQNLISMGRGGKTEAEAGISELAGRSLTEEIANVQDDLSVKAADENMYGSIAGTAAGVGLKMYSASGSSTDDATKFANNRASNPWGDDVSARKMSVDS